MTTQTFLTNTNQSVLLANQGNIITIRSDTPADQALQTLVKHHILSAPCVNQQGQVSGLIDMGHFTEYILELIPSTTTTSTTTDKKTDTPLRTAIATSSLFSSVSAKTVDQVADTSAFQTAPENTSLLDLVRHLAQGKHRVIIVRQDNSVANIITQSAVLGFVAGRLDQLGEIGHKTVSDLGLGQQGADQLISITATDIAADGFRAMVKHHISAVPVLHADGQLMGNLSLSDLKGVGKGYEIGHLALPVPQFLQRVHADEIEIKSPTIVCRRGAPLSEVIQRMSAAHIHRIYVIDDNKKVIGVITLTDVMRILSQN